jgi:hypothetical protein
VLFILNILFFRVYKETNKLRGSKKCGPLLQTIVSLMAENVNDIRLSPEMMAMFYGRTLVDIAPPSQQPAALKLKFLGDNRQQITILVNDPHHTHLSEQELTVLTRMLDACRVNIGDVAIVNVARQAVSDNDLIHQLKPLKILDFGTDPSREVLSAAIINGCERITAPPLAQLTGDGAAAKQLKMKLWGLLKQSFGL